ECRDKEFVYDLYITQKLSRLEIANMFDVPKNKIASLLDYHQIPKRNRKNARVARIQKYGSKEVSEDLMNALEGLLLSDGTLTGMKHVTAYNLAQSRAHREYCEYFRDRFLSEGIHAHVSEKTYLIDGKAYPGVVLNSQGLTSLNNMLERFYPDREAITTTKGVYYRKNAKVIPDDLTLTPTHILHLYLGDGFASYTTLKRTQTRITLCTDGFSKSDQTELIRLIAEAMGVRRSNFKLHKHCGHY
ncbi:MAG: hypothetical protein ACFFCQ_11420, partial [Promethearchaeota archaeon]